MSEDHRNHETDDASPDFDDLAPATRGAQAEEDSDLVNLVEDETSPLELEGGDGEDRAAAAAKPPHHFDAPPARRSLFKAALAIALGLLATVTPLAAGVWMWLDPLLRRKGTGAGDGFIEVARFSTLPADGTPVRRPVVADRRDAWNTYPAAPIGAVYLRRTGESHVLAISVVCPHAGCFVSADTEGLFRCPCHESEFDSDGRIIEQTSTGKRTVSPRDLDTLEARVEGDVVLVRFQQFIPGKKEKIAKS